MGRAHTHTFTAHPQTRRSLRNGGATYSPVPASNGALYLLCHPLWLRGLGVFFLQPGI